MGRLRMRMRRGLVVVMWMRKWGDWRIEVQSQSWDRECVGPVKWEGHESFMCEFGVRG